ncbi:hypothetical protein [Nocardia sp. NBC_01327]|uniref:hypothetical protein n=1 Tax=Nocardia sp. NBC_01327 TaxID=2903593 RepID=UPI002E0E0527|nr:hypothetical protein OG326_15330 [Nocardia sp. NBC_01327]
MSVEIADMLAQSRRLLDSVISEIGEPDLGVGDVARISPGEDWGIDLQRRLRGAREEIVVAISDPIQLQRQYPVGELVIREMLAVGTEVKLLMSSKYADSRDREALLAGCPLSDLIRVTYSDFRNTMIIDRRVAIVWARVGEAAEAYVFTENTLMEAIHRLMTQTWSSALSLRDHADLQHKEFDATAISVVKCLNAGVTDEVAARMLSVSLRTYRRYVADVMARLEAPTRFQLGVRAAELGLLR